MKIAVLTDQHAVNSEYRSFPLLELRRLGHEVTAFGNPADVPLDVLRGFDVAHVYRFRGAGMMKIARPLHDAGVALVWDSDDDHASGGASGRPDGQRPGKFGYERTRADIVSMLQLADVATTTNPVLAEKYASWSTTPVQVVPNYLPERYAGERRRRDKAVVIGWVAASEHRFDARALEIRAVLARLLDAHAEVRVVCIGIDLDLPADRYEHHELVQYGDLAGHVANFDVGLAPLADIPFNHARSDVKAKEYAAMAVPWLASPIGPYVALTEAQGGRLVADGEWHAQLERLVVKARERRRLAKQGAKWARSQRVLANLAAYETPLRDAVERAAQQRAVKST